MRSAPPDPSAENLARRLAYLASRFRVVSYVPELDRIAAAAGTGRSDFDRLIHGCGSR